MVNPRRGIRFQIITYTSGSELEVQTPPAGSSSLITGHMNLTSYVVVNMTKKPETLTGFLRFPVCVNK